MATTLVVRSARLIAVAAVLAFADTYARPYPQLQGLDLREQILALDEPAWVVKGRHEARGRVEPAQEWFEALQAPERYWVVFERSSH